MTPEVMYYITVSLLPANHLSNELFLPLVHPIRAAWLSARAVSMLNH